MSDKSHDAEPESEENLPGDPASQEELDVSVEADDAAIAELEESFSEEEVAATDAIVRKTAKAPVKKGVATPKQAGADADEVDPYKAKNPAHFVRQSAGELKQVVWPTWPETVSMFSAVLIFVLIMIVFVGLLDFAFGWGLLRLLGGS